MIDGATHSKLHASMPIGYGLPHSETVGVPQSERRGMPHTKSGSIGACLLWDRTSQVDAHRAVRMGHGVCLVRDPLDANSLVTRLDRLLYPGVHVGSVEEHGRRILEMVISEEIANLELEITLQMYRGRVVHLDEPMHEFRKSQELP
ncbi:hypothetical protein D1007_36214 [Hordeum vulgare]|nr:hypothetical protein D1007_36214 [Hordeum vulgare]